MMKRYLTILSYGEGASLLLMLFLAMPRKYIFHDPSLVKALGPVHGLLYLAVLYSGFESSKKSRGSVRRLLTFYLWATLPFGMLKDHGQNL